MAVKPENFNAMKICQNTQSISFEKKCKNFSGRSILPILRRSALVASATQLTPPPANILDPPVNNIT